jgi:hypothetical protein
MNILSGHDSGMRASCEDDDHDDRTNDDRDPSVTNHRAVFGDDPVSVELLSRRHDAPIIKLESGWASPNPKKIPSTTDRHKCLKTKDL